MVKTEIRTFGSRYLDQTLMYPGKWVLTWVLVGATWVCVSMEPAP